MVKVDTGKLDGLLDLVGEMVIAQSLVGQDMSHLASLNPQFGRNMAHLPLLFYHDFGQEEMVSSIG